MDNLSPLATSRARARRVVRSASASSPTAQLGLRKATILLQLLHFALEFRFVLKAIVTRQATHDFAAFPILEDTAQVFAGYFQSWPPGRSAQSCAER